MDTLLSYLPQAEGLLPKWLLLVSLISVGNSIQAYSTLALTSRVYNPSAIDPPPSTPPQVTALQSRTFGTWTFLASLVRFYAAYNINEPTIYKLVFWTYIVAWAHFVSEWKVFGTARWGKGIAGPVFIATGSLAWIWAQWGFYVKA